MTLKMAISAGIGFFLAIIALQGAGIVVNSDATLVTFGDTTSPQGLVADSGATIGGVVFGTSTTTTYIESPAGVYVGGRVREVHAAVWLIAALFALRFLFLEV